MSFCQPHLERKHVEILATKVAFGTPMCDDCFGSGEDTTPVLTFTGKHKSQVLRDLRPTIWKRHSKRGTGTTIVKIVSEAYGMVPSLVMAGQKSCKATIVRQVSIFILRNHLNWSWSACGDMFHQHHTTAMHAVDSVERRMYEDEQHRKEIGKLYKQATGQDLRRVAGELHD